MRSAGALIMRYVSYRVVHSLITYYVLLFDKENISLTISTTSTSEGILTCLVQLNNTYLSNQRSVPNAKVNLVQNSVKLINIFGRL